MPRDNASAFYWTPGQEAVSGQPVRSGQFNATRADILADANAVRPIASGGTGASNPTDARTRLKAQMDLRATSFAFLNYDNPVSSDSGINLRTTAGSALVYEAQFARTAGKDGAVAITQTGLGDIKIDGGGTLRRNGHPVMTTADGFLGSPAFLYYGASVANGNIYSGLQYAGISAGGGIAPGANAPGQWRALGSLPPGGGATLFGRVS